LGKVSIAVVTFGVCDFSRLAVTDWRLQRWRLWFLALMTATQTIQYKAMPDETARDASDGTKKRKRQSS